MDRRVSISCREIVPISQDHYERFHYKIECNWITFFLLFPAVQCGELNNPPNGVVSVTQTVYPGSATYSCNTGYSLSGGNTRNCQTNAMWSGTAPVCTGMCNTWASIHYIERNLIVDSYHCSETQKCLCVQYVYLITSYITLCQPSLQLQLNRH